jgi:aspartate racemase
MNAGLTTVGLLGTAFTMEQDFYAPGSHAGGSQYCVGGIVLGCTEIELLVSQADATVPVFPTTRLHVEATVDASLAVHPLTT